MWNQVNQKISQALSGVRQAFRVVLGASNSSAKVQTSQVKGLSGEDVPSCELFQHYGFTSNPPSGTMGIAIPLGGVTSHSIIVATEHGTYRLKSLVSGEVAIYTDEETRIVLKRGRIIETDCDVYRINCKSFEVNAETNADFNTPMVTASQEVTAQAKITGNGGMAISGSGGSGPTATFTGTVQQNGGDYLTDGDVKAGTVSVVNHQHPNGGGGSPTGAPMK